MVAYFKEINRVLSVVTASSKNRYASSNSRTSQVILYVSKDKDFSTRCSNPEKREVMWEKSAKSGENVNEVDRLVLDKKRFYSCFAKKRNNFVKKKWVNSGIRSLRQFPWDVGKYRKNRIFLKKLRIPKNDRSIPLAVVNMMTANGMHPTFSGRRMIFFIISDH